MDILLGRTVSQIKNRFYQNLKDKDITQIRYKSENINGVRSSAAPKRQKSENKKSQREYKEKGVKEYTELNRRNKKAF